MALHILINMIEGQEPTLYNVLHVDTKEEKRRINEMIRKFQKEYGYPVRRIVVTGDSILVIPVGQEEVV